MKYRQILAFGDSVVFGDELTESFDPDEQNSLAFPNILGQMLGGIPVVNCAMIGGSNDRSLRLLPEMLLTYPDSLVIFCYTSFDRAEFYLPTAHKHIPNDRFYVPLGVNFSHVDVGDEHRMYNEIYLKYFCHRPSEKFAWREYNFLLQVQLLCEKYASDYRQLFLYSDLIPQHHDNQRCVLDQVNLDKIITFGAFDDNCGKGSVYSWLNNKNAKFLSRGHPDKIAHQQIADHIRNNL